MKVEAKTSWWLLPPEDVAEIRAYIAATRAEMLATASGPSTGAHSPVVTLEERPTKLDLRSPAEEVQDALAVALAKDPFIRYLTGKKGEAEPLANPLPAPIGANCPEHPTFPLVLKDGGAWCRRGQHCFDPERSS